MPSVGRNVLLSWIVCGFWDDKKPALTRRQEMQLARTHRELNVVVLKYGRLAQCPQCVPGQSWLQIKRHLVNLYFYFWSTVKRESITQCEKIFFTGNELKRMWYISSQILYLNGTFLAHDKRGQWFHVYKAKLSTETSTSMCKLKPGEYFSYVKENTLSGWVINNTFHLNAD